jgi:hypothetical protein
MDDLPDVEHTFAFRADLAAALVPEPTPRYTCFLNEKCPGNHASKWETCREGSAVR